MSHTIPKKFSGVPTLTSDKIVTLKDWYTTSLGDSDMATEMYENAYYSGAAGMAEGVLRLIYENVPTEKVVDVVKSNNGINKKKVIVVGVTAYILWKNRVKVKAKIKKLEEELKVYKNEIKDEYNKK